MAGGAQHLGRVLVVDDDLGILRVCQRVLGGEGWEVIVANSGRDGLAAVRGGTQFDCVLSDVNMPDLDGFELIADIHRQDEQLPILLMTGDPSLDGAVRAIDSGAVSYISKPFSQESLASAVARAARRHGVARMRRRADSVARLLYGAADDDRRDIEMRFGQALERSWMAFQPIIDVVGRRVYAYEGLIRTDVQSLTRPDILIATAERLGRVHQLGRTVRANVVTAIADAPPEPLIFVNVHGLELTDEELFATATAFANLAPRIVLEITERTGIDPVLGPARVAMLRKLGYKIAVDDLGAGYAALGALATLEPDVVKLDMSLIRDLDRNTTKRRVVGAIATLCRELGARVVAEGVETPAERAACLEAGIDLQQGYLYARPARGFPPLELATA